MTQNADSHLPFVDLLLKLTDTGENVQNVDASIFDSALSHNRRLDASEKKREENSVSTF